MPKGEGAVGTVNNGLCAAGLVELALQKRQEADAVFGLAGCDGCSGDRCAGRHEIAQLDQLVTDSTRRRVPGPAGEKGHAVTAFPGVALDAA